MLADSIGMRRKRSTRYPTGIVNTAPTSNDTAASSPILALPMCRALSSCGATAPTVAVSAPLSASTAPKITITLARAGPPTRFTTSPRSSRPIHRVARSIACPTRVAAPGSSRLEDNPGQPSPGASPCSSSASRHPRTVERSVT